MQQYVYRDIFKGEPRELLIISQQENTVYRIYCDGIFLGILQQKKNNAGKSDWTTVYNVLKPVARHIGMFLEGQQSGADI